MIGWFAGLENRDKRILVLGSITLVVVLLYALMDQHWAATSILRQRLLEQTETFTWMQQAAAEAASLTREKSKPSKKSDKSLLALIDASAKKAQLASNIKRIQPDGTKAVKVWLDKVDFGQLMRWLKQVERDQGITIKSASLDREKSTGKVNARLALESAR